MEEASRGVVNLICFFILGIFAATSGLTTDAVDIFNVKSGTWTTAVLSVARQYLAATSLPNEGLAIFAGGAGALFLHYVFACRMISFCLWEWRGMGASMRWRKQRVVNLL